MGERQQVNTVSSFFRLYVNDSNEYHFDPPQPMMGMICYDNDDDDDDDDDGMIQ